MSCIQHNERCEWLIGNLEVLPSQACCACLQVCRYCSGWFVGNTDISTQPRNFRIFGPRRMA